MLGPITENLAIALQQIAFDVSMPENCMIKESFYINYFSKAGSIDSAARERGSSQSKPAAFRCWSPAQLSKSNQVQLMDHAF